MATPEPTRQDEEVNPFAPPQAADTSYHGLPHLGGRPHFTVESIGAWTWRIYRTRFTQCVGVFWGVVALTWLCQLALGAAADGIASLRDQSLSMLAQFGSIFLGFVVAMWLSIGQNLAFLKIARGEPIALEDIFSGGRLVLTVILASILVVAILAVPLSLLQTLVIALLNVIVTGPSLLGVLAILAACLASIAAIVYLFVRLGLFMFVIIDQSAGVLSSLAIIWRLGTRRVATIFLVYMLWLTINLAGLLVCCMGLVFTFPFGSLMLAVTYHALVSSWAVAAPATIAGDGRTVPRNIQGQ